MIYIEKNKVNNFVLTLTEKSRLFNPEYLFVFTNEYNIDAQPILFTTPDISNYTNRYNQFKLIEDSTGSKTGSNDLPLNLIAGQYIYKVYEYNEEGFDFTIAGTTGKVIEEGRMIVNIDVNLIDSVYI